MKTGIRIIACIMMISIALTMALFTLADFRGGEDAYVLRDYDGTIAVFRTGEREPIAVTDIELATLRTADRDRIISGLPVFGEAQLQQLLEDLGS